MKSLVNRALVVLMVGALTGVVAFAKTHKHRLALENDLKVNGTVVKKGNYEVKFDDETNQLSIIKNGKVVAQATARVEQRDKKANDFQLRANGSGDDSELVGVTFGGSDKDVVLTAGGTASGTN